MGRILIGTAVVVASASAAFGAGWMEPSGTSDSFSFDSGGDINGLFGEPIVWADTFYFMGSHFQVNAASGETATQDDAVSFNVRANPGLQFAEMHVTASGSYSVGGSGSYVDVDAGMSLHELEGLGRTWSEPLVTTPSFPISFGGGAWDGDITVNVAWEFPTPDDYVNVNLSNVLRPWLPSAEALRSTFSTRICRFRSPSSRSRLRSCFWPWAGSWLWLVAGARPWMMV